MSKGEAEYRDAILERCRGVHLSAAAHRRHDGGALRSGRQRPVCLRSMSPEDLAIVPGGQWVIASGLGGHAGIRAIKRAGQHADAAVSRAVGESAAGQKTYKSCPGPSDAAGQAAFKAHGLYLQTGKNRLHRLFVVHHGSRESIEVFDVDASAGPPTLTWVGCAVAPEGPGLNAVVGLADGGFIVTNFHPRGQQAAWIQKARAGENTGEVWEWHPTSGWAIVPGGEAPGPNGLEISKDGKWLYIGVWGAQSVTRLSRGQTPVQKDSVVVGFRVRQSAVGAGWFDPRRRSRRKDVDMWRK